MSFFSFFLRVCSLFCLCVLAGILTSHEANRLPMAALFLLATAYFWELADTDWSDDDSEEKESE